MNGHLEVAIALVVGGSGHYIRVRNRVGLNAIELDGSGGGVKANGPGIELLEHIGQILSVCGPKRQNRNCNEREEYKMSA